MLDDEQYNPREGGFQDHSSDPQRLAIVWRAMSGDLDEGIVLDFMKAFTQREAREAAKATKTKAPKAPRGETLRHGSDVEIADTFATSADMTGVIFTEGKFWRYDGRCWGPIPTL